MLQVNRICQRLAVGVVVAVLLPWNTDSWALDTWPSGPASHTTQCTDELLRAVVTEAAHQSSEPGCAESMLNTAPTKGESDGTAAGSSNGLSGPVAAALCLGLVVASMLPLLLRRRPRGKAGSMRTTYFPPRCSVGRVGSGPWPRRETLRDRPKTAWMRQRFAPQGGNGTAGKDLGFCLAGQGSQWLDR